MAYLKYDCPHCGTIGVQFSSCGGARTSAEEDWAMFQCSQCRRPIIVRFLYHQAHGSVYKIESSVNELPIIRSFPLPIEKNAPYGTPENVSNFFQQGISSLNYGNFDASGSMFRKALDVATKAIGGTKDKLAPRINELKDLGLITEDMKQWAHEIRIGGNEAVHDESPYTRSECEDLLEFTKLFLMYSFTLPEMIKKRRAAKSS